MPSVAHSTTILAPAEQARVRAIMTAHGIRRATAIVGVSRHAMERAAGGLTIQRGTAALLRAALSLAAETGERTR